MYYVFFFSSRRRHTSSLRDWSSDVCSSDLSWLSGRVPGGRLQRCLLARSLVVHAFRGREQAPTQQIQLGAAEHLALEHLQPIDVTLDRAITPRQSDAGFDGVVIVPQPFRKPLKRLQ